nr:hypothetical protein [Tanacetum cinerariifolium]
MTGSEVLVQSQYQALFLFLILKARKSRWL